MNDEKVLNHNDVDVEECVNTLKQAFQDTYNRGVWHGGFALAGGIALGTMIYYSVEHLVTKKK